MVLQMRYMPDIRNPLGSKLGFRHRRLCHLLVDLDIRCVDRLGGLVLFLETLATPLVHSVGTTPLMH